MRFFKWSFSLFFTFFLGVVVHSVAQTSALPKISAIDSPSYLNQEVIISDQVVQVVASPTGWMLHLNRRYPNSPLNCVIPGVCTNNFSNLESYLGQHIEVTGRITDSQGRLELALTSADQIKIVSSRDVIPPAALSVAKPPASPTPVSKPLVQPALVPVATPPPSTPPVAALKIPPSVEPVPAPPVIPSHVAPAPPAAKPQLAPPPTPVVPSQVSAPKPAAPFAIITPIATTSTKPTALAPQIATPAPASSVLTKIGETSNNAQILIITLLIVISVLLAVGILVMWKRNPVATPAALPSGTLVRLSDPTADSAVSVLEWKQRALMAEAMAGRQVEILREKIIPELTEFARQSLVQGLVAQRTALLKTNLAAQQSLIELENRLTTLHAPLQDRIRAYEERIAELEREVANQGDQVRELTRASLTLLRKKLEDEREHARLQSRFN